MQNVLITGGSRGIGAACVQLFAQNGFRVFFTYRQSHAQAEALAKKTGALALQADAAHIDTPTRILDTVHAFGPTHILVNNAGIAQQKLFSDITEADWDRMFDVNIKSMFRLTQAVLPDMIHQKQGRIINLSSIWGQVGASCEVHYSAAKAAVIGFTKALAKELGPSGITVNCVAPGLVDTDMNAGLSEDEAAAVAAEIPLGRAGTPAEIARTIFFLAQPKSGYITGQVLAPNGGWEI